MHRDNVGPASPRDLPPSPSPVAGERSVSGVRRVSGVDWPLLLSCFACLWHEAAESEDDVVELAGSESLQVFWFSWRLRNGIAPHPSVLLAD